MALSGELKDFGLLQLLSLIQITRKSGALTLQRAGETAIIFFENGQLAGLRSPDSRGGSLATALYRTGKIDRDQYELISAQDPPSEKALGLLLEDQGVLSREEMADFIRERSLADLYSLLTWADGIFRLDVGAPPPEEDIAAPIDLAPILERGRGYLDEWQLLVSYIPDLDRSVRLMPDPQLQEVRLGLPEWRLVASLAGDLPLREVGQRLGLDEFAVRQVAYRLIDAGLAEVVEPTVVPPVFFEEPREVEPPRSGALSRLFGKGRR